MPLSVCTHACVVAGWAGRGIQRPVLPGGCCGRGLNVGEHEGQWGTLGTPKGSTGSPPAVAPHTGGLHGGLCLGTPRGSPSCAPYSRPLQQFPHVLGSRSWRQHPSWNPLVTPKPSGMTTPAASGSLWRSFWKGEWDGGGKDPQGPCGPPMSSEPTPATPPTHLPCTS